MAQLAGLQFGAGIVLTAPSGGNQPTDPTPLEIGVVQNVKLTIAGEIKQLYGQTQWSLDSAVGKRSVQGTVEFAQISNELFANLFFGDTPASGVTLTAYREAHSVPATTPYTVTVTNSADFTADYGVTYATTGEPFTLLPTGTPAQGQYTVSAGVYTFAAADASAAVLISYRYTSTTGGTTLTVGNHPMGWGPLVAMNVSFQYDAVGPINFYFPNVRLGKIDMATKIDDYNMGTSDFVAFAGANNSPFVVSQPW